VRMRSSRASATPEALPRPDSSASQELDQARRALLRDLARSRVRSIRRAAAFRDGLQHVAEEGGYFT